MKRKMMKKRVKTQEKLEISLRSVYVIFCSWTICLICRKVQKFNHFLQDILNNVEKAEEDEESARERLKKMRKEKERIKREEKARGEGMKIQLVDLVPFDEEIVEGDTMKDKKKGLKRKIDKSEILFNKCIFKKVVFMQSVLVLLLENNIRMSITSCRFVRLF